MPMPTERFVYTAEEVKNQTNEQFKQRLSLLTSMSAIPIETIVAYIENGVLDANNDNLIFQLEKALDRRIKPFNEPRPERTLKYQREAQKAQSNQKETAMVNGKSMPVAKTDQLEWMDKQLSTEERYKVAVERKDAKISASDWLQKADIAYMVDSPYFREWCVPELFDYLSMGGEQAVEELRAVAYPLMVSFDHTTWKGDGKDWVCPYITFSYNAGDKNNGTEMPEEVYARTFSFYLNHKREVQIMRGKIVETYYEHDFSSKKDMLKYIRERQTKFNKKHNDFSKKAHFINIKLAEGVHAIIQNDGTEGNLERKKGVPLNQTYKWCQTYDVTNSKNKHGLIDMPAYWDKMPEESRQRIERIGRASLEKLDDVIFNPERYRYVSEWYEGKFCETYAPKEYEPQFYQ